MVLIFIMNETLLFSYKQLLVKIGISLQIAETEKDWRGLFLTLTSYRKEKYQERKWIPFTTSSSSYFSCIVTHYTMVLDTFLFYFDDLWFITRIVRDKFVLTERKVIITKSQWFLQAIENIDKSHLHVLQRIETWSYR